MSFQKQHTGLHHSSKQKLGLLMPSPMCFLNLRSKHIIMDHWLWLPNLVLRENIPGFIYQSRGCNFMLHQVNMSKTSQDYTNILHFPYCSDKASSVLHRDKNDLFLLYQKQGTTSCMVHQISKAPVNPFLIEMSRGFYIIITVVLIEK